MSIEVGSIVSGKVSGITNFGAFVDLDDHKTGLVHISQVSNSFVKDIHDVLSVGDEVKVKVVSIGDDGKIALSIKATEERPAQPEHAHASHRPANNGHFSHRADNNHRPSQSSSANHSAPQKEKDDFDSMLSGFLKESESRLSTIRRNTEGKRGGRGGRRS